MSSVGLRSSFATAEEVLGGVDTQSAQAAPGSAPAPAAIIAAPSVGTTPDDHAKPAASSSDSPQAPPRRPYPAPAELPTQHGPKGLRFDFNDGCRVMLPESEGPWR